MRLELEQKLMSEFTFMQARNMGTEKLLDFPMPCSCGDGWFNLIYELCKDIQIELGKLPSAFTNGFFVVQVKEKFGTLRFYVSYGNQKIFRLIEDAEAVSATVCEECGDIGELRGEYWVRTLCDKCDGKRN